MTKWFPAGIRLVLITLLVLAAGPSEAANPVLLGTFGPGNTIHLKKQSNNSTFMTLPHGTYTVKITDQSTIHNFVLTGKGVSKSTSVSGRSSATWTVTFQKGQTYMYYCVPHKNVGMKGSFKVT